MKEVLLTRSKDELLATPRFHALHNLVSCFHCCLQAELAQSPFDLCFSQWSYYTVWFEYSFWVIFSVGFRTVLKPTYLVC
jgi:hypothetical protein